MRLVRARPFADHFRRRDGGLGELAPVFEGPGFFYSRWNVFTPLTVTLALIAASAILGLWYRPAAVAALALALGTAWIFARTRSEAMGLHLRRIAPERALEHRGIALEYELRNAGGFAVQDVLLRDRFSGSRKGELLIPLPEPLPAAGILRLRARVTPDGGMGPHHFGPLTAIVSDPLGIFQFTVTYTDPAPIEILPEYIPVDGVPMPASTESQSFGLHESPLAGHSPNVAGVREYVPGDPIKSVSWKLSARHGTLIVREFESSVNTDVTVFVDMDERSHIGTLETNTWEWAKDVAISLVHGPLERVNRVQLLSQAARLEFGAGRDHAETVIRAISRLAPARAGEGRGLREAMAEIPYGSAVVYVGPVYHRDGEDLPRVFRMLRESGVNLVAFLLDARTFIDELRMAPLLGSIAALNVEAETRLRRLCAFNAQLEIPTYVLTAEVPVRRSLAKPVDVTERPAAVAERLWTPGG